MPLLMRLSKFMMGSVAAQGMAALTGLLLAHWLPVHDYAIYTIMTVIMGTMTLLTKGGVHLGYSALLGRDWPDQAKVDAAGKVVVRIRRLMSVIMLPPICAVAAVLLLQNGVSYLQLGLLVGMLLLSWYFDMQTRVIDQILFFAKQTSRVQMLDTALNAVRLLIVTLLYLLRVLSGGAAIAVAVLIAALRVTPIKRWIVRIVPASPANQPSAEDYAMVRNTAMRQMPIEIFTVFQTQIMLFTLGFFAGTASVASYGALSRIPQLLVPIQVLSYAFIIPAYTRQNTHVIRRLIAYSLFCAVPAFALVMLSWLAPGPVLMLIGGNYGGLEHELVIATLNAALFNTMGIAWNLLAHRGLNHFAWLQIPVGLAWCAAAPFLFDLTHLSGALWLQAGFSLGYLVAICAEIIFATRRGKL